MSRGPRAVWLDQARGLAVIAMVAYHFMWDLSHFRVVGIDVAGDPAWRLLAKATAASFLIIAGIALALATRNGVNWPAFLRRLAILAGAALLVTAGTWMIFPTRYVFFGILHAIAVSSVLALAFLRLPAAAIALASGLVLALPHFVRWEAFDHPALMWLGLGTLVPATNDFEPIFPWFGWMLAGGALGRSGLLAAAGTGPARGVLAWLGRWSLIIYLLHQPVLFNAVGFAASRGWLARSAAKLSPLPAAAGEGAKIAIWTGQRLDPGAGLESLGT